jgi:hypothetical protein
MLTIGRFESSFIVCPVCHGRSAAADDCVLAPGPDLIGKEDIVPIVNAIMRKAVPANTM